MITATLVANRERIAGADLLARVLIRALAGTQHAR
jgi:hypothetical protein